MKFLDDSCSHYLIPNFSGDFLEDTQTPIYIGLPYPVNKPFKYVEEDVVDKFHENSDDYINQLQTLCKEFPSVQDRIMNQPFHSSHASITEGLLHFYKTQDYATPFPCDYNPYYASGCLELFSLNNINYLIRPDTKNNLCVTNTADPWKTKKINLKPRIGENINGINSGRSCGDVSFLIQCKNEVKLIQMKDINEDAEVKWNKTFKQKILNSNFNKTKIGVLLSNTKLKLYDLETRRKLLTQDYHSGTHLDFIDENTILILGQNCVKIADQRSEDYKKFQPELDDCDKLCSVKVDDDIIYLASRHHLLRTDIRYFKNLDFCTHLMKTSPCYMDFVQNENKKFLCLSSQKDEKMVFNGNPISSLPVTVPSMGDTLTKCKTKKDVLLIEQLDKRLQKSIIGIKLICDNNDVFLYSVNSLGDVFKQKISEDYDNDVSNPINNLCHWINELPATPKPLHLTDVVNLSDARFTLNRKIAHENLKKYSRKSKKANLFLNHFNNVYNKANLGDLAANFLSIWEEEEAEREVPDLVPVVPALEKVHSWIESSYFAE